MTVAWMRAERSIDYPEEIRLGASGDHSIAYEHCLERALLLRRLSSEDVGQQVQGLEIAPAPPQVRVRNGGRPALGQLSVGREARDGDVNGRWSIGGREIVSAGGRAARHLDIQRCLSLE